MRRIFKTTILLTLVLFSVAAAQSDNPDEIIKNLKTEFERVKDYQVDVKIKVNANMLKVPEMNVEFFFKQPDKTHIKSNSFALIPKQGVNFSPFSLLKGKYKAVFARNENIDGRELSILKIIPLKEDNDVMLTTIWVDQTMNVVRKLESTTKGSGTFNVDFIYDDNLDYPLPAKIIFSFNLDKKGVPKDTDIRPMHKRRSISGIKGKMVLTYTNYKVNIDLPDSLFEKKK